MKLIVKAKQWIEEKAKLIEANIYVTILIAVFFAIVNTVISLSNEIADGTIETLSQSEVLMKVIKSICISWGFSYLAHVLGATFEHQQRLYSLINVEHEYNFPINNDRSIYVSSIFIAMINLVNILLLNAYDITDLGEFEKIMIIAQIILWYSNVKNMIDLDKNQQKEKEYVYFNLFMKTNKDNN